MPRLALVLDTIDAPRECWVAVCERRPRNSQLALILLAHISVVAQFSGKSAVITAIVRLPKRRARIRFLIVIVGYVAKSLNMAAKRGESAVLFS
jgi:hypothetical protein